MLAHPRIFETAEDAESAETLSLTNDPRMLGHVVSGFSRTLFAVRARFAEPFFARSAVGFDLGACSPSTYSARNASSGSIRDARSDGTRHASTATTANTTATPA